MNRAKIESKALRLLLRQPLQGTYALHFFDYRRMLLEPSVRIDSISAYEKRSGTPLPFRTDGMTVKVGSLMLILYDDALTSRERIHFTLAHELGHVYLRHTETSSRTEREANAFAAALLMPEAVVRFLDCQNGKPLTPEEMTLYFGASLAACRRRREEIRYPTDRPSSKEEDELIRRLFTSDPLTE